jgi:hypothetical protein
MTELEKIDTALAARYAQLAEVEAAIERLETERRQLRTRQHVDDMLAPLFAALKPR